MPNFVNNQVLDTAKQQAMQAASLSLQQQQAEAAADEREFRQQMLVLDPKFGFTPEQQAESINKSSIPKKFNFPGPLTANSVARFHTIVTGLRDVLDGKDKIRRPEDFQPVLEMFLADPNAFHITDQPTLMEGVQQVRGNQIQHVSEQLAPSVPGGPEAAGRTQEARGRLAIFNSVQSDDPSAQQKLEAFTQAYGSKERLTQQIEADKLVVQAEDVQQQERSKIAALLRVAPADLAKQTSNLLDQKTMLLPIISKLVQQKGVDGLEEQDQRVIDAHYIVNGQYDKLNFGSRTNELRRYQQDLQETQLQLGTIGQIQVTLQTGKTQVDTFAAAASDALTLIKDTGTVMKEDTYGKRQALLGDLAQQTNSLKKDWQQQMQPMKDELLKGSVSARKTIEEINAQMARPGVDRIMLSKRRDFYQQMAETSDRLSDRMGIDSDLNLALKRLEVEGLTLDATKGPTEEIRQRAKEFLPEKTVELHDMERTIAQQQKSLDDDQQRLQRYAKVTQARITAGDKKLELAQLNGVAASAFVDEWIKSKFTISPDEWSNKNNAFFLHDPKGFMDIVKPMLDHRKEIKVAVGQRKLLLSGDPKQAGPISSELGISPESILPVLKDPNKPLVEVNMAGKASEEAAKDFTKSTRATYDQLKSAPILLRNIDEAKALIPQAKGFMGPGGETLMQAAKFLNNRLGAKINTEGIKGAEELRTRIFFNIMENLKKMDAQPSELQQQMMQEALGKLGTDPNALANVLDAYGDTIRDKVELFNREVAGAEKKGTIFPYDPRIIVPERKSATGEAIVKTDSDYKQLPSGTVYIGPDGKRRTKQ